MSVTSNHNHTTATAAAERWFGIEVRHLAALAAVDNARSFRFAAEELGYVQSAVSQQIAMLERLVGTRLVERERGRAQVALTGPGQRLVSSARKILAELESGCTDARRLADGSAGTLRLGISQDLAPRLLPGMLRRLRAQSPVVCRELRSEADLCEQISGRQLDVGVAELPLTEGPFHSHPILVDPTVLVMPATGSPSIASKKQHVGQIAELELVAHDGWRALAFVIERLKLTGLTPRFTLHSHTASGVLALVAAGLGAALMPKLAVDCDDPRFVSIDLEELPSRTLVAFWHSECDHGEALAAVIRAAKSTAREMNRSSTASLAPASESAGDITISELAA